MPTCLTLWIRTFRSRAKKSTSTSSLSELRSARNALLHCVHDCSAGNVRRLQEKIQNARTHRELWSLRSEIYHCVAMHHHQAMATERVQSLAHHFEGWIEFTEVRQKPS